MNNTMSNNTVTNAVVVNNTNNENMVNNNSEVATPNAEETPFRTVKAQIQGEVQDIILARHKYSMEGLKASQQKQLELIDKSKMLGVIFHLATAEVFYEAGIALRDLDNNEIPAGTENVFVPVETADTFYRFTIDDVLENVEVHTFANVQEFAEVTGTTTLFSRGLTSKEKIGVAALATNDEVCNAIFDLALEGNMPASTAQLYLGVQVKGVTTAMMATGYKPKDIEGLGRTYAEAKELFERVSAVFGVNEAKKRYAVRAINYLQKSEGISLEQIHNALETIPANEVAKAKLMNCGEKETCIVTVLLIWIKSQENKRMFVPAA
ncbi:MAG: hypothetical protein J6J25_06140 [Bacteroidales bacterium]|nr:hypothetical protein [Bacteroidales bacterium]